MGREETILGDSMASMKTYQPSTIFKGKNFELWELKLTTFLEYYNVDLLKVIETRVSSLLDTSGKILPRNTWTDE